MILFAFQNVYFHTFWMLFHPIFFSVKTTDRHSFQVTNIVTSNLGLFTLNLDHCGLLSLECHVLLHVVLGHVARLQLPTLSLHDCMLLTHLIVSFDLHALLLELVVFLKCLLGTLLLDLLHQVQGEVRIILITLVRLALNDIVKLLVLPLEVK